MHGPHASRNTHERNLERSLGESVRSEPVKKKRPDEGEGGRRGDPDRKDAQQEDVASRMAREAAEREARRRAKGRTSGPHQPAEP